MRIWTALWEALFPYIPRCAVCGTEKGVDTYLCPHCAVELDALRMGETTAAGLNAFSAYRYDSSVARVVQSYKYGGNRWLSGFIAHAMLREALQARVRFDCVCHVPLHAKKRHRRGFDQAALLAKNIAALTGKPAVDAIKRIRNTPSQTKLDASGRKANMRGAFEAAEPISGDVLLVDDVLTTGATVAECAGVLKSAGAQSVTVLTFARAGERAEYPVQTGRID